LIGSSLGGTGQPGDLDAAAMDSRNRELEDENEELKGKVEDLEEKIVVKDAEIETAINSVNEKVKTARQESRREVLAQMKGEGGDDAPVKYGSEMRLFSRFLVKEYGSLDAGLEALDLGMDEDFSVADFTDAVLDSGYLESLSAQLFSILDVDAKNVLTCNKVLGLAEDYIYAPITQDHIEREQRIWSEKQWQNEIAELQLEIANLQKEDKTRDKQLMESVLAATQSADVYNQLLAESYEELEDTGHRSTIRFNDSELGDVDYEAYLGAKMDSPSDARSSRGTVHDPFASDAAPRGKSRTLSIFSAQSVEEPELVPMARRKSSVRKVEPTSNASRKSLRQSVDHDGTRGSIAESIQPMAVPQPSMTESNSQEDSGPISDDARGSPEPAAAEPCASPEQAAAEPKALPEPEVVEPKDSTGPAPAQVNEDDDDDDELAAGEDVGASTEPTPAIPKESPLRSSLKNGPLSPVAEDKAKIEIHHEPAREPPRRSFGERKSNQASAAVRHSHQRESQSPSQGAHHRESSGGSPGSPRTGYLARPGHNHGDVHASTAPLQISTMSSGAKGHGKGKVPYGAVHTGRAPLGGSEPHHDQDFVRSSIQGQAHHLGTRPIQGPGRAYSSGAFGHSPPPSHHKVPENKRQSSHSPPRASHANHHHDAHHHGPGKHGSTDLPIPIKSKLHSVVHFIREKAKHRRYDTITKSLHPDLAGVDIDAYMNQTMGGTEASARHINRRVGNDAPRAASIMMLLSFIHPTHLSNHL